MLTNVCQCLTKQEQLSTNQDVNALGDMFGKPRKGLREKSKKRFHRESIAQLIYLKGEMLYLQDYDYYDGSMFVAL